MRAALEMDFRAPTLVKQLRYILFVDVNIDMRYAYVTIRTHSMFMAENVHNPYHDKEYRKQREASLGIIPKSTLLSAISRNAGIVNQSLAMAAVAAIVSGVLHVPVWGVVGLILGAVVAASVSAYIGYLDEKMSRTTNLGYSEVRQATEARVNAKELAGALQVTLGEELKDIRHDNFQTQRALVDLQRHTQSWIEREGSKQDTTRTLQ